MTPAEARHLTRYLREHRICKPFSKAALARGTKIEKREHPGFTKAMAREIARDHLCAKGDRAYPVGKLGALGGEIKWQKIRSATSIVHGRLPGLRGRLVRITDASGVRIFHTAPGRPPRLVGQGQMRTIAEAQAKRTLGFDGFVPGRKVPRDFGALGGEKKKGITLIKVADGLYRSRSGNLRVTDESVFRDPRGRWTARYPDWMGSQQVRWFKSLREVRAWLKEG